MDTSISNVIHLKLIYHFHFLILEAAYMHICLISTFNFTNINIFISFTTTTIMPTVISSPSFNDSVARTSSSDDIPVLPQTEEITSFPSFFFSYLPAFGQQLWLIMAMVGNNPKSSPSVLIALFKNLFLGVVEPSSF